VLAHSRMRSVLPELLGGRKINAAGEVSFWRNAMLKIFLETHPSMGGDVLWNRSETTDEFENMMNGLQQWMFLRGMHANAVAPAVIDPTPHQLAKIQRICIKNGWPVRTFMGSELGQLAADTDKTQHKDRVKERQHNLLSPTLAAPVINRFILVGVLEKPSNGTYGLEWPPVGTQDELKKAQVLLARTQAAAAWVAGNVGSLIPERGFLVDEMGVPDDRADGYLKDAEKAIADEEKKAQALADEHGMVPTPPDGFEHPPPPPEPPAPVKVKPGERLVQPKPNPFAKRTANVFCPTGEGGGIDPSCSPGGGGSSTAGGGGGTASGSTRSRQAGDMADKPTLAGKSGTDRFASPPLRADAADTLEAYRGTDGRWTPERQALHDEIIGNSLAGKDKSDAPTMYFMGGGPASGKSTIIGKGGQVRVPDRAVLVDPDHFKTMLPEYKAGLAARDSHAAAFVHEESSEIGKQLQREASTAGYDTLMDGTGDSGIDKLAAKVNQAKQAGQRVVAHYVTVDTDTAVARANERGQKTGRYVPEAVIRGVHAGVSRAVPEAIDRGLFDEFTLWDTNQPTPRKVAEARGKSPTIHDRDLWDRFVAKGR
jgi:predicted ABC-type ATPase